MSVNRTSWLLAAFVGLASLAACSGRSGYTPSATVSDQGANGVDDDDDVEDEDAATSMPDASSDAWELPDPDGAAEIDPDAELPPEGGATDDAAL